MSQLSKKPPEGSMCEGLPADIVGRLLPASLYIKYHVTTSHAHRRRPSISFAQARPTLSRCRPCRGGGVAEDGRSCEPPRAAAFGGKTTSNWRCNKSHTLQSYVSIALRSPHRAAVKTHTGTAPYRLDVQCWLQASEIRKSSPSRGFGRDTCRHPLCRPE